MKLHIQHEYSRCKARVIKKMREVDGKKWGEIAEYFGVSTTRVMQLYNKIIRIEKHRAYRKPVYRIGDPFADFKQHYDEVMGK